MLASTSLMVPEEHLTRIQGLNQSLQGGLLIVSAPLGALLYAVIPMAGVMAVDAVTALFALVPLAFIDVPRPAVPDEPRVAGAVRALWSEISHGLRYIRQGAGHVPLLASECGEASADGCSRRWRA